MTQFLSVLFFLAVLAGSLGIVWATLRDHREAILAALAGAPIDFCGARPVNFVNFRRPARPRVVTPRRLQPLRAAA